MGYSTTRLSSQMNRIATIPCTAVAAVWACRAWATLMRENWVTTQK